MKDLSGNDKMRDIRFEGEKQENLRTEPFEEEAEEWEEERKQKKEKEKKKEKREQEEEMCRRLGRW